MVSQWFHVRMGKAIFLIALMLSYPCRFRPLAGGGAVRNFPMSRRPGRRRGFDNLPRRPSAAKG